VLFREERKKEKEEEPYSKWKSKSSKVSALLFGKSTVEV
jgi:hypothetical protein